MEGYTYIYIVFDSPLLPSIIIHIYLRDAPRLM